MQFAEKLRSKSLPLTISINFALTLTGNAPDQQEANHSDRQYLDEYCEFWLRLAALRKSPTDDPLPDLLPAFATPARHTNPFLHKKPYRFADRFLT
jgi:hypothetical protein